MMKKLTLIVLPLLLTSCVTQRYALDNHAIDGEEYSAKGTVISVERDGDFVLETCGKLLFVDVSKGMKVELGDRVIVSGKIDNDDEDEAAELDAESIEAWPHK